MLFETPVETKRLLLRSESEMDCAEIYKMNTDPDVMRFVGDGSVLSASYDRFLVRHRQLLCERSDEEYGFAAVVVKETNRYIGACWLKHDSFLNGIELGYRYVKDAWGKGYATEAGEIVLAAGFENMQLQEIYACCHPQNQSSIRVLDKLGFKHTGYKYHPDAKIEVPIYSIKRLSK